MRDPFPERRRRRRRKRESRVVLPNEFEVALSDLDVALVMDQAHCTDEVAREALRQNNNDLVDAIMELTPLD
jgi:NACalpha-BTF3-like transcription factor